MSLSKDPPLFAAMVKKFSMGRSTGFQVRNWQKRYLVIFPDAIGYYTSEAAFKAKEKPKFEALIKNFSLCIMQASPEDHPEAVGPLLFILRVWDGGVFDLLVRPSGSGDKAQFMAAIRQATAGVKGFQMVGDADVLGGEDARDDVEELEVPKADAPERRTPKAPSEDVLPSDDGSQQADDDDDI